ncbi:zinc finger, CCHC-type containing protein [Tanacetum coccineum]
MIMTGNTVKDMTTNFGKLDKFKGHDFRRWHKKMHFLLTTLKVVYVLTTPMPELLEDATVEAIRIRAKWENDDYICRGHILNGMSDSLFDVYTNVESAKELWDSLESKYMAEDSSSKKFLKDFKHTLKHGKDDLSLVQLGSHLRIEESLRAQDSDKGKGKEVGGPSVNMTEEGKNKHNKQNKGKKRSNKNNSGSSSNKKPKLECWKCGKTGHFKRDCRSGNKKNANAGGSGKGSKDHSQDQGFGYYNNGMFMLNLNKVLDDSDSVYMSSSSTVVNSSLWHDRLGHVHYKRMMEMSKDDLISVIDENPKKCTTCIAVVRLPNPKRKTLDEKDIDCIFVGYAEHSKAYRFYVIEPNDFVSINSIIESRDAIFDENRFSSIPRPKDVVPNSVESQMDDYSDDVLKAINDKIGSIMKNNTWVLSDLPPGYKPLGCKWIFKRKMKVDGTIDKFKARLVIQGFRQKEGIDYFDTYASVARIATIRLLLALDASQSSDPSNGCQDSILEWMKQAPKQWHQKFNEIWEKLTLFIDHYTDFLGKEGDTTGLDSVNLFQRRISIEEASHMIREITNKEIHDAIFAMGDNKAPGPDGYSAFFFKEAWDIVGGDIIKAVKEFFTNGVLLKELNHTIIALIPKRHS